jgi:hypothetical protein
MVIFNFHVTFAAETKHFAVTIHILYYKIRIEDGADAQGFSFMIEIRVAAISETIWT